MLITTSTAARILHRADNTVRKMEREGRLRAVRTASGVRLFESSEVEQLAAMLRRQDASRATVVEGARG